MNAARPAARRTAHPGPSSAEFEGVAYVPDEELAPGEERPTSLEIGQAAGRAGGRRLERERGRRRQRAWGAEGGPRGPRVPEVAESVEQALREHPDMTARRWWSELEARGRRPYDEGEAHYGRLLVVEDGRRVLPLLPEGEDLWPKGEGLTFAAVRRYFTGARDRAKADGAKSAG